MKKSSTRFCRNPTAAYLYPPGFKTSSVAAISNDCLLYETRIPDPGAKVNRQYRLFKPGLLQFYNAK
jgi:hypothetical protein